MFGHFYRVAYGVIRDSLKGRSLKWSGVELAWKSEHPFCAACMGSSRVQVHHKIPFHLNPALELDPENLISLCMGPNECHLRIGHGGSFSAFNPEVESDCMKLMAIPSMRSTIEAQAKAGRRKIVK